MQKNYVLLRNDQQTGPYSLEEISRFDLKPYDLIWIEGESRGWYYPQEIQALHPYLSFLPQKPKPVAQSPVASEKKVFVAVPAAPKKEEPLAMQPEHETSVYVPAETYKPSATASKDFEEEIYAQFVKPVAEKAPVAAPTVATKRKTSNRSVSVAVATVLVVGGVFAASWVMNRHPDEDVAPNEAVASPNTQQEINNASVAGNDAQVKQTASATKQKKTKSAVSQKQKTTTVKLASLPKEDQKTFANNSVDQNNAADATAPVKEEQEPPVATAGPSSSAPAETTAAPQEKKKKLRDKIFDIFRGKPDEQKSEETKPAETENGERRSTRREDGANLAQLVSIRFTVPNDWMMGIKGAKATLVNRSSETIGKAVVDVLYYDDDNNLLQKKTISFGNVDGKDSKTVSIPDHSTATRVDYNVVSVTGKPGA